MARSVVKISTLSIVLLAGALVVSNAWWFYQALDAGITATYRDVSFRDNEEALAQAIAVIPVAIRRDATREQVIAAATTAAKFSDSFEKDGYVWVGKIGLKFNDAGRLESVAKSWAQ
jgi:hypothetical protein